MAHSSWFVVHWRCEFQISNFKLYCPSTIGRTCAFESKFGVILTGLTEIRGCQKRSNKNFQFSDFRF